VAAAIRAAVRAAADGPPIIPDDMMAALQVAEQQHDR
jgi:hypothetical protein